MYLFYIFFFLMIRRPPRSTLFPYTRSSDLDVRYRASARLGSKERSWPMTSRPACPPTSPPPRLLATPPRIAPPYLTHRSEEHTSELQSRLHLVCRLLLEKKKKKKTTINKHN